MEGVWYDFWLSDKLRDEAPAAYKDIKAVLRAQRDLVKMTCLASGAELQGCLINDG
jgi:hypothetical protein